MQSILNEVRKITGAKSIGKPQIVQELWSGYGSICRYELSGCKLPSVILKRILLEETKHHPRGWKTNRSHLRKVESYRVEKAWYKYWSNQCTETCRVPHCYKTWDVENESYILLEDLDAAGFAARPRSISEAGMKACLRWLADFHVTFLNCKPEGLWKTGTYWHLATRPDELKALDDLKLKSAAQKIDEMLNNCSLQTFVHGDAKLANFCFTKDQSKVAAVDFQYVGGGAGIKDVAYFLGSCLAEHELENHETELLDMYFEFIGESLDAKQSNISRAQIEDHWRPLFPVAWTDFHRFLKGWSPGHWKLNDYSEKIARNVIEKVS